MIQFILNQVEIKTDIHPGTLLLDYIRYQKNLKGTKIGCREGDCGACTVLIGEIKNGKLQYTSATSCLMAIGNAHNKHIVTIEGLNGVGLNAVQQAFSDESATQCGFCTPGFIVSLTGYCLDNNQPTCSKAIDAMNGNICRCTGYKSIEKAAWKINDQLCERKEMNALEFAVQQKMVPEYFLNIQNKISLLIESDSEDQSINKGTKYLGGGTDLYVQQHDTMLQEELVFLYDQASLKGIHQIEDICELGAAVTVADIANSPIFQKHFPHLQQHIKLVSSTQIRNMATIAGNFTNASPIGDLTIMFLALNAQLQISDGDKKRKVPLREFYLGYKKLDKSSSEFIEKISFQLPKENDRFAFEKVSKRTHLDIASVNASILIRYEDESIIDASIAAGGVGPIPAYLPNASLFLKNNLINEENIAELLKIVQSEISPIGDARGTEAYKRLLLSQLIKAQMLSIFPHLNLQQILSA